jgi:hypothetical protein
MTDENSERLTSVEETWRGYLTGKHYITPAFPRRLMLILRHLFRFLPADHRCRDCNAPFHGLFGLLLKPTGFSVKSILSPKICAA